MNGPNLTVNYMGVNDSFRSLRTTRIIYNIQSPYFVFRFDIIYPYNAAIPTWNVENNLSQARALITKITFYF